MPTEHICVHVVYMYIECTRIYAVYVYRECICVHTVYMYLECACIYAVYMYRECICADLSVKTWDPSIVITTGLS